MGLNPFPPGGFLALGKFNLAYEGDTGKKNICKYSFHRDIYIDSPYTGIIRGITGNYQRRFRRSMSYSVRSLLQLNKHIKFEITTNVSGKLEYLKIIGY